MCFWKTPNFYHFLFFQHGSIKRGAGPKAPKLRRWKAKVIKSGAKALITNNSIAAFTSIPKPGPLHKKIHPKNGLKKVPIFLFFYNKFARFAHLPRVEWVFPLLPPKTATTYTKAALDYGRGNTPLSKSPPRLIVKTTMNSHKESKESGRGDTPLSKGPSSYIVELLKKKPKPLAHYSWKSDWYANREPTPLDMGIKNTTKIEGLWPRGKNSRWHFELLLDFFANSNFNKTFDHRYVAELDFQGQWDLFSFFGDIHVPKVLVGTFFMSKTGLRLILIFVVPPKLQNGHFCSFSCQMLVCLNCLQDWCCPLQANLL